MEQKQTAVEYLEKAIDKYVAYIEGNPDAKIFTSSNLYLTVEQAKEIEKQQKNKLPIVIHEGIENTWVYIEDGIVHVTPNPKANEQQ